MGLIIKPKGIQLRVLVGGKIVEAEVVKCNSKTFVVKLNNGDIIKVKNFKLGGA